MKRKKFIKNMMSVGISRNAANWVCREGGRAGVIVLAQIMNRPGIRCITNVAKTKDGVRFRALGVRDA